MPLRIRLAEALHEAANLAEYNLSHRMQSVHGGPRDGSYLDAADMILDTRPMASLRDDLALDSHVRHGEIIEQRDAMRRRAEAAEGDWQAAERRVTLLEAIVREAVAHIEGVLTIDTARWGARAWLKELPERMARDRTPPSDVGGEE